MVAGEATVAFADGEETETLTANEALTKVKIAKTTRKVLPINPPGHGQRTGAPTLVELEVWVS